MYLLALGDLKAHFPYSLNWIAGCIKTCSICAIKAIQRQVGKTTTTGYYNTTRS